MAKSKPADPVTENQEPVTEPVVEQASIPDDPMKDMTTVLLPRATGKEENFVLVGLNGKVWKIMKGVPVRVPRPVKAILDDSIRAEKRRDDWDDQQQGKMIKAASYL